MIIVTGVKSEQIFGPEHSYFNKKKSAIENELGIEFMN